jgi:hypothetical protein
LKIGNDLGKMDETHIRTKWKLIVLLEEQCPNHSREFNGHKGLNSRFSISLTLEQ